MMINMESLSLPATEGSFATPNIHFDLDTKVFVMEGESFLENTDDFYAPILAWLTDFVENFDERITFNFKFYYYNSSSSKCILKIFKLLKKYNETKQGVEINWYYPEGNEDLLQEGEDFANLIETDINFFEVEQPA